MVIDLSFIVNILVFVGASILGFAFFPIRRLVTKLAAGSIRKKWNSLSILILLFLLGYIGYHVIYWETFAENFNLVLSTVFFFSSVFVLLVGSLTLQTATELNQIFTLRRDNIIDPVIGIYNRRYFDVQLSGEINRAHRYHFPISLLLLDIDHFKKINDTFGHYVGDLVLKSLGQLLLRNVRETDIVAHYGGEEIAIIALHTPISSASVLAERLRQVIEKSIILPPSKQENRQEMILTISIGVAALSQKITDPQTLIKKADQALYQAKREGRNRIAIYDDQRMTK